MGSNGEGYFMMVDGPYIKSAANRFGRRLAGLPVLLLLAVTPLGAAPVRHVLRSPEEMVNSASSPGKATVQYLQLVNNEPMDDKTAGIIAQALGPDRVMHFRYDQDYPDDHVFPNGLTMGQIHQWLTAMIADWNKEPLMPLQISLERGQPDTQNVIKLDDTSSEAKINTGFGTASWSYDGTTTTFSSRAVINVDKGSLSTREMLDPIVKHEIGHCLTLQHTPDRPASMAFGYTTFPNGLPDNWARVGFTVMDDLLGLRSVWARNAPGFGALEGHLQYLDGSPVGGGDVVVLDASTGEVLATDLTDGQDNGRFRIELPAGRQVHLIAHPMNADDSVLGQAFLPSALFTTGGFEPTEFQSGGQDTVFTVPDGSTTEIDPVMVNPAAATPLLNKDAPVAVLLPGQRVHMVMKFDGLGSDPATVTPSLAGLSISNVSQVDDRVEFDVSADSTAAGASTIEVGSGSAANLQVGSVWVRPRSHLVLGTAVEPKTVTPGSPTDVVVHGYGLDQVTAVRVVSETGTDELDAQLVGPAPDGGITVRVSAPSDAAAGPWDIQLVTAGGPAPQAPEPRPRLWVAQDRIEADPVLDLGDVPIGQPVDVAVHLTNHSTDTYSLTGYQWSVPEGNVSIDGNITASPVAAGSSGMLDLSVTPGQLGPTVITFGWLEGGLLDAVTEVRLWAVPAPAGN
jgi:hypothetical protein